MVDDLDFVQLPEELRGTDAVADERPPLVDFKDDVELSDMDPVQSYYEGM